MHSAPIPSIEFSDKAPTPERTEVAARSNRLQFNAARRACGRIPAHAATDFSFSEMTSFIGIRKPVTDGVALRDAGWLIWLCR